MHLFIRSFFPPFRCFLILFRSAGDPLRSTRASVWLAEICFCVDAGNPLGGSSRLGRLSDAASCLLRAAEKDKSLIGALLMEQGCFLLFLLFFFPYSSHFIFHCCPGHSFHFGTLIVSRSFSKSYAFLMIHSFILSFLSFPSLPSPPPISWLCLSAE